MKEMIVLNRKKIKEYEELINKQIYSEKANNEIVKKLIIEPLIKIGVISIFLIFSLFNIERIIKLNNLGQVSKIFSSDIYFTALIFGILVLAIICGTIYFLKKKKHPLLNDLKNLLKIYTAIDLVEFMITTIIVLYFITMTLLTPCTISGDSMKETLHDGEKVLVWHYTVNPKNEDIIVFDATNSAYGHYDGYFIKRVVAKEYDIISYDSTLQILYVNNVEVENITAIQYKTIYTSVYQNEGNISYTFEVPQDRYMVLGDNRNNSTDSRNIGLIYEEDILGKVIMRFYPFSKIEKNLK